MTAVKTILVADDDQSVRTVLTQALKRAGYDVNATDNGATLYKWVANGAGDLVITDVVMPVMNGPELARRRVTARPSLRVLFTSGYPADAIADGGLVDGEAGGGEVLAEHPVAELAAEMCSPLFAKTTAAQLPVDGGNERVI